MYKDTEVVGMRGEGLLVRAEPLGLAEEICRRLVGTVRVIGDELWLGAAPAWSGAINTVLVKKGVRVSKLGQAVTMRLCVFREERG